MENQREIIQYWKSRPTVEGAGVRLRRAFGYDEASHLDPFLLLDDFRSDEPSDYLAGFPWHPHRGIETITYVKNGKVEHGDSLRNSGVISAGDVQWMTAGSGIIHQEMPIGNEKALIEGFQLWTNLPARNKMMPPRYRTIEQSEIPEIPLQGGGVVRVICGQWGDVSGPVRDVISDPEYMDVCLPTSGHFRYPTRRSFTVLVYIYKGWGKFSPAKPSFDDCTVLYFGDGDYIDVSADEGGVSFLLISGKPIHEPIAWRGPIVMNTQDELHTAFEEYRKGTFIKA